MNLLVVGCGRLGTRVALAYREKFGQAVQIFAHTESARERPELESAGITHVSGKAPHIPDRFFERVLFCVPPVLDPAEYSSWIMRAARAKSPEGLLVFTSSTSVYREDRGGWVREIDSINPESVRAQPLIAAEATTQSTGGVSVRLAGLYDHSTGPQWVYLRSLLIEQRPDAFVNLIHLDDAAAAVLKILTERPTQKTFLLSDGEPITRAEILSETLKLKSLVDDEDLQDAHGCDFRPRPNDLSLGKRVDPSKSWRTLGLKPRYSSFKAWTQECLSQGRLL
jgi:nucleoside-diphosphate-sugar epimerase